MAARRGRSQARRNTGSGSGSLPGWAWMVLGIVLTVGVILAAPRFLKGNGEDGFFRPRANPDAQPVGSDAADEADVAGTGTEDPPGSPGRRAPARSSSPAASPTSRRRSATSASPSSPSRA